MKRTFILFFCCFVLSQSALADGQDALPKPNWLEEDAVLAAESADSRAVLAGLYRLARQGKGDELLQEAMAIDEDATRPAPERDRILFELAVALGDFEPGTVGPQVLECLRDRPVLVRVPHEENPAVGVPLYNARAAAAGTLAAWAKWERQAATIAATAPRFEDAESFLDAIATERGPGVAEHVRMAGDTLDAAELEAIVLSIPERADPATAALVIGALSPRLLGRPAVDDLLFGLLGHVELGAGAALVLGHSGDEAVLERLADLAAADGGLASRRASLAIDLYLAGERTP